MGGYFYIGAQTCCVSLQVLHARVVQALPFSGSLRFVSSFKVTRNMLRVWVYPDRHGNTVVFRSVCRASKEKEVTFERFLLLLPFSLCLTVVIIFNCVLINLINLTVQSASPLTITCY